ncbi:MAG TPA: nitroreductase family deazaflavin-dependent oxidoreductase [Candidatus Dormibacteraeota bacterium]|jgi:deazaflavin-dependent oxidoreductase (nitroreductase family)
MVTHVAPATRVPTFVGVFNPIAQKLLGIGVPLGPNALITVRGRQSGLPRTTPVALVEIQGRRWVIGTFGDVNWVRNLRAAREATITVGKRRESVSAAELSQQEGAEFFAQVLGPYIRSLRLGRFLIGSVLGAGEILDDPGPAASRRPVFELHPIA